MARTPLSNAQRAAKVNAAATALPTALRAAEAAESDPNVTADERRERWAEVEELGATIHRQARLLAGKSRGG